jgi:hypothetical protein
MSGLTKTPTIIPQLLQFANTSLESRHKVNYQELIFHEDNDTYEGTPEFSDTQTVNHDTQFVGCHTGHMPFDSNANILRIVIPEPTTDNAGHLLFIKDMNGHCGNDGNTADSDNEILVVHYDGSVYTSVHNIYVAHGYEILISTGTAWKKFLNDNSVPS